MTLWARLTWQSAEPAAFSADLERRLGVPGRDGGLVPGARLLDLGTAHLEVRPWVREGPADQPHPAGRLMLEPVPGGEEIPGTSAAVGLRAQAEGNPARLVLVGLGWSTVELDRAESDLEMWLITADGVAAAETVAAAKSVAAAETVAAPDGVAAPAGVAAAESGAAAESVAAPAGVLAADDPHLGARARVRGSAGLPGEWLVLLEPSTEGRVAAALARDGEGPCALYLWPPAGLPVWLLGAGMHGVAVTGPVLPGGPFGGQVLLTGTPPGGPHVIVVERRSPTVPAGGASTIAP